MHTASVQAAGVLARCGEAGWQVGVVSVAGSRRWGQVGVGCVCVGGGALRVCAYVVLTYQLDIYIFYGKIM